MYGKNYFNWQSSYGDFGSLVDQEKFADYLDKNTKVLEFGCGGGYLLSKLNAKERIGIEINPSARAIATKNGLNTVPTFNKIKDNWADVIISNHALEHCTHPLTELKNLYKKLKKNGTIVFVTPHERNNRYVENDVNQHLYTWSELNLANLFKLAGYKIISVETRKTAWPPFYRQIYSIFGQKTFSLIAGIWGRIFSPMWEVRMIAKK
jgi:SAM-dependent methyltransferase